MTISPILAAVALCAGREVQMNSLAQRLEDNSMPVTESGCWLWISLVSKDGYGKMKSRGRMLLAHRVSWEINCGPIPPGVFVLHKCDTPRCWNPSHLFLGTAKDNATDMVRKGRHKEQVKTHCKNGHEFTPENIYWRVRKDGRTEKSRQCRTCSAQRASIAHASPQYLARRRARYASDPQIRAKNSIQCAKYRANKSRTKT